MPIHVENKLQFGVNRFSDIKICNVKIIRQFNQDIVCSKFVNRKLNIYYIDYDKIIGVLILRNRRNGDKIKLAGNNFTSSVKNSLIDIYPQIFVMKYVFFLTMWELFLLKVLELMTGLSRI